MRNRSVLLVVQWLVSCWKGSPRVAGGFQKNPVFKRRNQSSFRYAGKQAGEERIILPIFPLRKKVRLPTEKLTLNLYEENYLAMAEYVLQQEKSLFGALYCSEKPQVVKRGTGPIVPVVSEGDIGVVCLLDDSEEGLILTVGGEPRRRIRLVSHGAVRFQVTEIIHNGFDEGDFILVESKILVDDTSPVSLLNELTTSIQESIAQRLSFDGMSDQEDEDGSIMSAEQCHMLASKASEMLQLNLAPLEVEIVSFALAAAVLPQSASKDRLASIRSCKTERRVELIQEWLARLKKA
jgi:hypothetical protein